MDTEIVMIRCLGYQKFVILSAAKDLCTSLQRRKILSLPENSASSASRPVPLLQSAPSSLGGGMFPDMHYRQSSKRRAFC
jgi:hypothetical protein